MTVDDRLRRRAAGERDEIAHGASSVRLLPASTPSAVRTPVSSMNTATSPSRVSDDIETERRHRVGDQHHPLLARARATRPDRQRIDVDPVADQPGEDVAGEHAPHQIRASRCENGAIALNRCVTMPTPARRAAANSAGEHSLCPADTTTPAATSDGDQIERAVALGRERHHRDAALARPRVDLVRSPGGPIQRAIVGAGSVRRDRRTFEVEPERDRRGSVDSAWTIAAIASSAFHRAVSGAVTIVGRKAVTPVAGKPARDVADRVRIGREVVTPSAVELQIDEPGRDVHARDVDDVDRHPTLARDSTPTIVPSATVTSSSFGGAVRRDDLPAGQAQRAAGHITDSATRYARRAERSAPSAPTSIPGGEAISRRLRPIEARNGDRCSRSASAALIGSIKTLARDRSRHRRRSRSDRRRA